MIRVTAVTGNSVTKRELINCTEANFRASLTHGWIHCFLQHRTDDARKAVVAPLQLPDLQVPGQYPNHYIDLSKKWVLLALAELIFYLNKTGLSGRENSRPKPVLVPTDLGDSMIYYPVNRQIRNQNLL
jgi:hypothetical protein